MTEHNSLHKSLSLITPSDMAWAIDMKIFEQGELEEFSRIIGKKKLEEVEQSSKSNMGQIVVERHREDLSSTGPRDILSIKWWSHIRNNITESTDKLYEVMSILSITGVTKDIEWMIFLWPSNKYINDTNGDDRLAEDIEQYFQIPRHRG